MLREAENLSQADLATLLHVSRQTLSAWENNRSAPSAKYLARVAEVLKTTTDNLLQDEPGIPVSPSDANFTQSEDGTAAFDLPSIAERIRERRLATKASESTIAFRVGVTKNFIVLLEQGKRAPSQDMLDRLADALGTSMAYLAGATDDPSPRPRTSEDRPPYQAAQDLDEIIRDLAHKNPDLILQLRDTRENWGDLSDQAKQVIADGLKYVLNMAQLDELPNLRKKGKKGPI